jgi:hypothetical protein
MILTVCAILSAAAWAQAPYGQPPLPPGGQGYQPMIPQQPMQPGPPAAPQQEQPSEYAFRPDLTNPQFGQCLQMEKQWQALWNQYYHFYDQHRMMNPADDSYRAMTQYVLSLRQQLDQAWAAFSAQCIYFPSRR